MARGSVDWLVIRRSVEGARGIPNRAWLRVQDFAHTLHGLRLDAGCDVGVGIERQRNAGVAQLLLDDPRMHTLTEHDAGVDMPEILSAERRQACPVEHTLEAGEQDAGLDRATVGLGKDEIEVVIAWTELPAVLLLALAVPS